MYVCLCNGITDRDIEQAVADGALTLNEVKHRLGVSSQCGSCAETAQQVIDLCHSADPELYYQVA